MKKTKLAPLKVPKAEPLPLKIRETALFYLGLGNAPECSVSRSIRTQPSFLLSCFDDSRLCGVLLRLFSKADQFFSRLQDDVVRHILVVLRFDGRVHIDKYIRQEHKFRHSILDYLRQSCHNISCCSKSFFGKDKSETLYRMFCTFLFACWPRNQLNQYLL
jgi:hypothetical protein